MRPNPNNPDAPSESAPLLGRPWQQSSPELRYVFREQQDACLEQPSVWQQGLYILPTDLSWRKPEVAALSRRWDAESFRIFRQWPESRGVSGCVQWTRSHSVYSDNDRNHERWVVPSHVIPSIMVQHQTYISIIHHRTSPVSIILPISTKMAYNSFSIPRKRLIPREGLFIDPISYILARTVFNPLFNVPFFLLCRQFQLDHFAYLGPGSREYLKTSSTLLAIAGGVFWITQFLNWGANNNFTRAKPWNPNKELVLITGGSSGIGASVATRLAKEGSRVVVLDISPLTFSPCKSKFRFRITLWFAYTRRAQNITYYKCDLSDMAQIKSVMARVREANGSPTVLCKPPDHF